MSRFLKVFLRDPLSGEIYIAGFGKHPAWDDHIDDIGLASETLVLTKQLLYSGGNRHSACFGGLGSNREVRARH